MVFGWWFQTFFHNIWDNPSHWVIFFRGVETTSHAVIYVDEIIKIPSIWCIYWGFLYGGFLSHGGTSSSSIYRWSFHEKVTILWAVPFDATSICEMLDFYPIPGQWGISKMCTDDKANCLHSFKVEYPSTRSGFFFSRPQPRPQLRPLLPRHWRVAWQSHDELGPLGREVNVKLTAWFIEIIPGVEITIDVFSTYIRVVLLGISWLVVSNLFHDFGDKNPKGHIH